MRGGLLRGKPPLLFLRSGILAGQGSFLYAESRNKQNWRDIDMPNTGVRAMRCASCCSTSRTWTGCWARMSAARKRSRSMIASNGHAPKAFRRNAQPHIYVCSKGFRGAAPDKQRAVFAAAEIARKAKWVPLCPACPVCPEFATANVQAIGLHLCDFACE